MTANNGDDIYDLTYSHSFTLVDHAHLNNVVIDLDTTDESFREEINVATNANIMPRQARRILTPRKWQSAKPRTNRQPVRTPVHNLSTPVKAIKKTAKKNKMVHQPLPEEPKEKKTKRELNLGSCPICFEELGSKPLSATKCGHVFCTACIKRSIKYFAQCPQCRTKLKGSLAVHPIYLS